MINQNIKADVTPSNYKMVRQSIFNRHPEAAKDAMSAIEYREIFQRKQPKALCNPGIRPILIPNPNADDIKAFQVEWEAWKWDKNEFKEKQKRDDAMKEDMLSRMSPVFVQSITHPQYGLLHLSNKQVLKLADTEYGKITPAGLAALKDLLSTKPIETAEEIKIAANEQRNYYAVAKSAGQETSENEKVTTFMNLIHPSLAVYKVIYNKAYKDIASREFEIAVKEMIEAAEEVALEPVPANAATILPALNKPTSYEEFMANAVTAAIAAGFTKPIASRKPNGNPRNNRSTYAATRDPSTMKYCWSCGPNHSHSSSECRTPCQNHVSSATYTKQCGGKKTEFVRGCTRGPLGA